MDAGYSMFADLTVSCLWSQEMVLSAVRKSDQIIAETW